MRLFQTATQLDAALALPADHVEAFRFKPAFGPAAFVCIDCGEAIAIPIGDCIGTGYGRSSDRPDTLVCYACCGVRDRRDMIETGRATLYLTHDRISSPAYPYADGHVSNWPGTLKLRARVKRGAHNIARYRYDVWFSFDGAQWHGVQYGDNTQICHCRRVKH